MFVDQGKLITTSRFHGTKFESVMYLQVNQFSQLVFLFVFFLRRRGGSQFRGGFIFSAWEVILRLDMRKWIQWLGEMDLLIEFFGFDWRTAVLQVLFLIKT